MLPKDYREGHEEAINQTSKGEYKSTQGKSPDHQAGYKQGLTQAHNLRMIGAHRLARRQEKATQEHELPHWKQD